MISCCLESWLESWPASTWSPDDCAPGASVGSFEELAGWLATLSIPPVGASPDVLETLWTRRERAANLPRRPFPRLDEAEEEFDAVPPPLEDDGRSTVRERCQSASQRSLRSVDAWLSRSNGRRRLV